MSGSVEGCRDRSAPAPRPGLPRDRHQAALRGRGAPRDPGRHGGNLHPKWVIAVDPDIDIRNSAEVEWAQSFRVKPSSDVFIVDRTATAPLGPYTDGNYSSSVGIDATRPFGGELPKVSEVPGWREFALREIEKP